MQFRVDVEKDGERKTVRIEAISQRAAVAGARQKGWNVEGIEPLEPVEEVVEPVPAFAPSEDGVGESLERGRQGRDRQSRVATYVLCVAGGFIGGVLIGFAAPRGTADRPDLNARIADLEGDLAEARGKVAAAEAVPDGLGVTRQRLIEHFSREDKGANEFTRVDVEFPRFVAQGKLDSTFHILTIDGPAEDVTEVSYTMIVAQDSQPADGLKEIELMTDMVALVVPDWPRSDFVEWMTGNLEYVTESRSIYQKRFGSEVRLWRQPDLGAVGVTVSK